MVKTRRTRRTRRARRTGNCQRRGRIPRRSRRRNARRPNKKRKGGRPITGLTRKFRETKAIVTAAVQGTNCSSYQSPHPGGSEWGKVQGEDNNSLMRRRWHIIAVCWKGPRAENIPHRDIPSTGDGGYHNYSDELCKLFTWAKNNPKIKLAPEKLTAMIKTLRITEHCRRLTTSSVN
jgi:hypothetical protein